MLTFILWFLAETGRRLWKWFRGWLHGGPHFIAGPRDNPFLHRWYILPRNPLLNIYVHKFLRSDDDRALHDHPWASLSLTLRGRAWDVRADGATLARPGSVTFRRATHTHRVQLLDPARPYWTLFITGPKVREWGFACPKGWRHWRHYSEPTADGNRVGKGCD